MRDQTVASLFVSGTVCAFSYGFTPDGYVKSGPSSQDYLKDIDCLEAWIQCLCDLRLVLCRSAVHLDLKALQDRLLPVGEKALR